MSLSVSTNLFASADVVQKKKQMLFLYADMQALQGVPKNVLIEQDYNQNWELWG